MEAAWVEARFRRVCSARQWAVFVLVLSVASVGCQSQFPGNVVIVTKAPPVAEGVEATETVTAIEARPEVTDGQVWAEFNFVEKWERANYERDLKHVQEIVTNTLQHRCQFANGLVAFESMRGGPNSETLSIEGYIFSLLVLINHTTELYLLASDAMERPSSSANDLNNLSWGILTEEGLEFRDVELALRLAQRAVAQEDRPAFMDTLALARFENGDIDGAIELERRVLERIEGSAEQAELREIGEAALQRFLAAKEESR